MFRGSMVALVTPMTDDGAIDEKALESLIEFHIENGTDAIVAVGTTGESATLDEEEHCYVIRRTVKTVNGRIPVIAGTGSNSTQEAIDLTRCAKEAGADACLLVTPYYNKPTQHGLYLHHKAIAQAVDIPQILYNVPGRTAVDMIPETVIRLAEIENIIGIKEATGEIQRCRDILAALPDNFDIYSGDDATAMELMLAGAHGVISVTTNVAPKAMRDMCEAALAGEKAKASAINESLMALHTDLFVEANPIPVKWALFDMGHIGNGIRLPLTILSSTYHDTVRAALKQANVAV
ncbi:4-hydroxy-tetrahydrodipicolinate synthase [hydrothermal vent metagenome]|uniref:4-hydroxy-tetrahydrodipicolinate synthase n=1 Tax=hydrothermal vent metagenome TaxID=652676 RepID=A0A3B1B5G6_9ZZZZ